MKKQITLLCIVLASFSTVQMQAQSNPFLGEVQIFAGNFAPRGWAFCDGQLLPIAQNTALFSLLGTTYGGDGRTTFALPDLRGRAVIGPGNGPGLTSRRLGQKLGSERETLSVAQMPSHNHLSTTASSLVDLSNEVGASDNSDEQYISNHLGGFNEDATSGAKLEGVSSTTTINNTGGGQSHNNVQPSQTVNYIIALIGIYPSRS